MAAVMPKGVDPSPTLAEIRRAGGESAVRAAVEDALREHGTATAAAAALGTTARSLRRAAQRVGATWPELPPGPRRQRA